MDGCKRFHTLFSVGRALRPIYKESVLEITNPSDSFTLFNNSVQWFSVYPNITSKFRIVAIFKKASSNKMIQMKSVACPRCFTAPNFICLMQRFTSYPHKNTNFNF
jgi:hypothetical protein